MATKLHARKALEDGGGVGAANKASGMARTSGGRAGRNTRALAGGALVTRSGLVRRVWTSSEARSCTACMKRAPSSGVSAAHILSAEALSTHVQYSVPGATRLSRTHQGQYPQAGALGHGKVEHCKWMS